MPADKYNGYKLADVPTDPETLPTSYSSGGKSDNVIKVYYVKDDGQTKTVGYTVEYYKDGVHVTGDDAVTEKSIWVNGSLPVSVNMPADKYNGYKLAEVPTDPATLPASYSSGGKSDNVIKVYYVRDDGQTQPTEYTVQHKVDGEIRDTKTYTGTAWINDNPAMIQIEAGSLAPKTYEGYTFAGIDTTAKEGDSIASGTVITLTYTLRTDLSYKVEYYYTGANAPFDTYQSEANVTFGAVVNDVADSAALKPGYMRVSTENLPLRVVEDLSANVIKVWYGPQTDLTAYLHYNVEFYVDEMLRDSATGLEKTVWAGQSTANVAREEVIVRLADGSTKNIDEYLQYLGADQYYLTSEPAAYPLVVTEGDTVKVYYRSKVAQSGDLNVEHNYTRNTYLDDQLTGTETGTTGPGSAVRAYGNVEVGSLYQQTYNGVGYGVTGYKVYRTQKELVEGDLTEAQLQANLAQAQEAYDQAVKNYEAAVAAAGVVFDADGNIESSAAQTDKEIAEKDVETLTQEREALGERPADTAELEALKDAVAKAEAAYNEAKAKYDTAKAEYDAYQALAGEKAANDARLAELPGLIAAEEGKKVDEAALQAQVQSAEQAYQDALTAQTNLPDTATDEDRSAAQAAVDTAAAAKAAADQALTDAQSANAAAAEAIAALESEKTALEARNAELQAQMADPAPAEPSDAKMKEAELAKLKAEAAFQADPTYQAQLAWDQADVQLNTKTADAVARVNAAQLLLDQCSTALIARDEAETALEVAKAAVGGDKAARAKVAVLLSAGFKAAEEEVPVTNGAFVYEEGYSYRVAISYYAESRAYSPVVNPPVVVIPDDRVPVGPGPSGGGTPVTIIDDDVPMGALPGKSRHRRSLYTILDDDVPLGALPKTSGSRGAAVGGLGAFLLAAGAALGLTKKRKKEDEE